MTSIRPATVNDAAALAEVHVAAWRETYGRMLPKAVLDRLSPPTRAERWRKILRAPGRPVVYLAEQDGWIVGFVDGGPCRDAALAGQMPAAQTVEGAAQPPLPPMEIYEIYLVDAVKRQGIGGRLLRTIARDFVAHGATSAGVWVLGDNESARAFYERFGAVAVAEKIERVGGFDVHEVGYAWRDLARAFAVATPARP